ncbi:MAG: type II toxin-antitoxin system VapC family toxin [Opitutales bacterium]|nr:type II toxin-antitoxin system VapC family toxin [Opitutales bacterium]
MRYLLDTSVFSQPLRRKPVEACLLRWKEAGDADCGVSIVTIAEVEFGLALEDAPRRREKYRALLENRLTVLPADEAVWHTFARAKARQQRTGQTVADLDLLIAATASLRQLTVATLNTADFPRIEGVAWEDWSV